MKFVVSKRKQHGIALADLLIGLMIGSIVLAAAATMADAMSHGKRATEQMARSSNYLAQVHIRLGDLVMRAESITPRVGGGVLLTYADGRMAELYSDNGNRIVIAENGEIASFLSDPAQTAVSITAIDLHRAAITFDIEGAAYRMTATRRGGIKEN